MQTCPFKPGDIVIYSPSEHGYAHVDGERLEVGRTYVVKAIEEGVYVVVEGYSHPGGGLYWTEFKSA
jgi:hypothetical protein